jgi:hypothetical protein
VTTEPAVTAITRLLAGCSDDVLGGYAVTT